MLIMFYMNEQLHVRFSLLEVTALQSGEIL